MIVQVTYGAKQTASEMTVRKVRDASANRWADLNRQAGEEWHNNPNLANTFSSQSSYIQARRCKYSP